MNILYLAHRIPYPPNKGDKIRSFRQLEYLARRHRVWCACFVDDASDLAGADVLRAYCQDVAAVHLSRTRARIRGVIGLLLGGTMTELYLASSEMRAAIDRWSADTKFDAVVAFSSGMAPYALRVPAARRVLDLCDLDSQKWLDYARISKGPRRMLFQAEGTRLASREEQWIRLFDASVLITKREAADLPRSAPRGKVHIVGNGVSLPDLVPELASDAALSNDSQPTRATGDVNAMASRQRSGPTVGFVGVMDYLPNVDGVTWFVKSIWPQVRREQPNATFRIVGRSPTRAVRSLARIAGVEVIGEVEDVQTELRSFDVAVAPLRLARGLQNKVLEAMAAAKPVVSTSRAAGGLRDLSGRELMVSDGARDFGDAVLKFLDSASLRREYGQAAREYVAANHCWKAELQKFEMVVTGVITATRSLHDVPGVRPTEAAAFHQVPAFV